MAQIRTKFITNNAVTNAKAAQMAANTIKGNNTGSTANALDLTVSQVQSLLSIPTSSSPLPLNAGGTGVSAASANAAFNALSPMTTLGDIIIGGASGAAARLGIGTAGQVLTVVSGSPAWATPAASGITTIGSFNSQSSSANGLVISGTTLYGQAPTAANPGMVSIPSSASGLSLSTAALSVATDGATTKINGSNQVEGLGAIEENINLGAGDITNQYVDLSHAAYGTSNSINSVQVVPIGGPLQQKGIDYTVSLTGGSGGVTRITFAGDLATGGNAALIAGDNLLISYDYLA